MLVPIVWRHVTPSEVIAFCHGRTIMSTMTSCYDGRGSSVTLRFADGTALDLWAIGSPPHLQMRVCDHWPPCPPDGGEPSVEPPTYRVATEGKWITP